MNNTLFRFISQAVLTSLSVLVLFVALGENVFAEEPTSWENAQAGERRSIMIDGIECAFHFCPAGTYIIGSPINENERELFGVDESQHEVALSQPFWTMETETTQQTYQAVMGNNPSCFKGDDLPVERVSWFDCQEFVQKLNAMGVAPDGWVFSIPTSAEWEIAARAGAKTPYPWGFDLNGNKANCNGNYPYFEGYGVYLEKTCAVKSYEPNAWGIFDAVGNVWEWCLDSFGDYPKTMETDPLSKGGATRVIRGGAWDCDAKYCRTAFRSHFVPEYRYSNIGFRCVLVRDFVRRQQLQ